MAPFTLSEKFRPSDAFNRNTSQDLRTEMESSVINVSESSNDINYFYKK